MTESGKIVVATVLSVLAHVSLFTVLALAPDVSLTSTPGPSPEQPGDERSLEITLETAAAQPPLAPPQPPLPQPPALDPLPVAKPQAIRTQLDPENLRRTDEAPEQPATLASYNSKATPESPATAPSPLPNDADLALAAAKPASTPGEMGIDALGNYGNAVGNAIGKCWNLQRENQKPPLAVGEVRVQFKLNAQGQISDIAILSNNAGATNAAVAIKAVKEAKIPPIPPDRLDQLPGGSIQIVYSFTIFPSQ